MALVEAMDRSLDRFVLSAYRQNPPRIAQDAPADEMARAMRRLRRRWLDRFEEAGPELGAFFANKAWRQSDAQLRMILRKAGISVKFEMTPMMRDQLQATIHEQVGLIRSIASQHLDKVEGIVMRGVTRGADSGLIAKELQAQFGVTKRRAALIARDQTTKATATMTRARQQELGIEKAIWLHSGIKTKGHYRPTHLKNNGKRYTVTEGWYDPHEQRRIWPGELINCRCVSKPVIAGF